MNLSPVDPNEILVIVGPTASGKSALAVVLAERYQGEVINADSVQLYRHFDIGSGKPTEEERARAPHHLYDILDPLDAIDAGRYAELADEAIADIRSRGRLPIICGGTFLWVLALTHGLARLPAADPEIRARHTEEAEQKGRESLYLRLAKVDPIIAARLSPNDFVRVSRALEVHELTGKPLSALHEEHGFVKTRYPFRMIGVDWPREDLADRISKRTRAFLNAGWVDEVRDLIDRGYRDARAMGSVGYRQVLDYVEGRLSEGELAEAIDRATRKFTRRQRTWLRDRDVLWLQGDRLEETLRSS